MSQSQIVIPMDVLMGFSMHFLTYWIGTQRMMTGAAAAGHSARATRAVFSRKRKTANNCAKGVCCLLSLCASDLNSRAFSAKIIFFWIEDQRGLTPPEFSAEEGWPRVGQPPFRPCVWLVKHLKATSDGNWRPQSPTEDVIARARSQRSWSEVKGCRAGIVYWVQFSLEC